MRIRALASLFLVAFLAAAEDPFAAPPEIQAFTRRHTAVYATVPTKIDALVRGFFAPPEEGGLGMVYDNSYTRTVQEAWRDRKANCLTLTALYVAACRSIGLEARYGESLRVSRWRRVGPIIRYERHIVAIVPAVTPGQELIADFLPEVRRGSQMVLPLDAKRVTALFYSNRAVELLETEVESPLVADGPDPAMDMARKSLSVDPLLGLGWNILGVIQRTRGLDREAEASFRKALDVDPRDGAPCGNLESLLRAQGRLDEAQAYRERGLEIRKKDPYFNAFLAEEALASKQWDECDKRIRAAIRLLPQEPEFYVIQAQLALQQGQVKDAIKSLEKARRWSMPDMQARFDSKLALLRGQ